MNQQVTISKRAKTITSDQEQPRDRLPASASAGLPAASFARGCGSLLERVIETAPNGLIIIDEKGTICSFNPAAERMFGYKASEIIGQNVSHLMPSPQAEKHDSFLARYIRTGQKTVIDIGREVMALKKNGQLFPVELAVGEVTNEKQRLFTGFVSDLTEQRLWQKQITELQNELIHVARHSAMGELATTLSHELNQPLTAIAAYIQVTRQLVSQMASEKQTEPILQLIDKTASQAQRAGEVIRSIRSFVKYQENIFDWEDLKEVVCEAVEIATIGAARDQIEIRVKTTSPLPPVFMDRVQIQQVVTNLVRNAVDAVRTKSGARRVRIELGRHGKRSVIVKVTDNGPGITETVQKKLFEAFNTSKPEGVGIGLAISRTIIASHNGDIRGTNLEEGGAEFHFILPIDAKAEETG